MFILTGDLVYPHAGSGLRPPGSQENESLFSIDSHFMSIFA